MLLSIKPPDISQPRSCGPHRKESTSAHAGVPSERVARAEETWTPARPERGHTVPPPQRQEPPGQGSAPARFSGSCYRSRWVTAKGSSKHRRKPKVAGRSGCEDLLGPRLPCQDSTWASAPCAKWLKDSRAQASRGQVWPQPSAGAKKGYRAEALLSRDTAMARSESTAGSAQGRSDEPSAHSGRGSWTPGRCHIHGIK